MKRPIKITTDRRDNIHAIIDLSEVQYILGEKSTNGGPSSIIHFKNGLKLNVETSIKDFEDILHKDLPLNK
jgi:hypothetical protein